MMITWSRDSISITWCIPNTPSRKAYQRYQHTTTNNHPKRKCYHSPKCSKTNHPLITLRSNNHKQLVTPLPEERRAKVKLTLTRSALMILLSNLQSGLLLSLKLEVKVNSLQLKLKTIRIIRITLLLKDFQTINALFLNRNFSHPTKFIWMNNSNMHW